MNATAWVPGHVEQFIKMIGIYPTGTAVLLSKGRRGIVDRVDSIHAIRPDVLLINEKNQNPVPAGWLDLEQEKAFSVIRTLDASEIPG